MDEQKRKVIFNWDNGWQIHHLALTESQLRLLEWAIENGYINDERVTIEVLEEQQDWEEI